MPPPAAAKRGCRGRRSKRRSESEMPAGCPEWERIALENADRIRAIPVDVAAIPFSSSTSFGRNTGGLQSKI